MIEDTDAYYRILEEQNTEYTQEIVKLRKDLKIMTAWMKYHRAKERMLFEMLHGAKLPEEEYHERQR